MSSRVCLMNVPEERAKSEGKLLAGCSDEERVRFGYILVELKASS